MWIWILNELSFVKNYFKRLFNKLSVNYFYLLNEWTKVSILSDGNKVDTVLLMGHAIRSDSLIQLFWQFQVVFDLECKNSSDMQQEKIAFKHLTQIGTFTIMKYTGCTQCATPKLPKKVLHIGDIVAHWGHYSEKMRIFEKLCTYSGKYWKNRVWR